MGHVLEHRPGNTASTLGGAAGPRQNFFGEIPNAETDPMAWWESVWGIGDADGGDGTSLGREPTTDVPPAEQTAFHSQDLEAGYEVTDSETSDGNSAPPDFSDVAHLSEHDQDAEI